jgi:chromosome segregation protein
MSDSENALSKNNEEASDMEMKVSEASIELERVKELVEEVKIEEKIAKDHAHKCEEQLLDLEEKRASLQIEEEAANFDRSEVEGEAKAIRAEFAALEKLIEKNSQEKSHIIDGVRVDPGFEKAFGAALSDDLRAPLSNDRDQTGWVQLTEYSPNKNKLPDGVKSLSDVVKIPTVLNRRLKYVGLVDRQQGDSLHESLEPGQRLVSLEGDLWRWDGYKICGEDTQSTAALQIQQVNTFKDLGTQLDILQKNIDINRSKHEELVAKLSAVVDHEKTARQARRDADQSVNDSVRKMNKVESEESLLKAQLENHQISKRRFEEEAQNSKRQVELAKKTLGELDDLDAMRKQVDDVKLTVEAARLTMMTKRSLHDEVRRDGEIQIKRAQEVQKEISGWTHRLETTEKRMAELIDRKNSSQWELEEALKTPAKIEDKREKLVFSISETENKKAETDNALSLAETQLNKVISDEREAERVASEAREDRARSDAKSEAARQNLELASDRIREALGISVENLLEEFQIDGDDLPHAESLEVKVGQIKRQREALGSVNLRAEEDAREVEEEYEKLFAEKADLEQAIKTLRTGIASLNSEGRERLLTAFEQVNLNFSMLFKHLFGGGEANLEFVESDDPLEAGLEIMCQPPGKKLAALSLLSGGEQTLTALALIFAVFLANPAPICVLDEVDAPLDDANVSRFCELLDEMCRQTDTRFMIITHHAVTMSRMDRLFGVTMQEQGVSQLVSVDLKKAESLVA